MINRLKKKYIDIVVPAMKKEFGYLHRDAVPKIQKAVLNSGIGGIVKDDKKVAWVEQAMSDIAGQKAIKTMAKKAIAAFKTREGMALGIKVSLRGKRMYDFMDRLISIALPRTRDFHGINRKSIDQNGNITIGIPESIVFPETSHDKAGHIFGFEVTMVTNAKTKKEAEKLFTLMGFPIKKES